MKIIAIWERPEAPEGGCFLLLDTQELLEITAEEEFLGKDAEGNRLYRQTGRPSYSSAFHEEDCFDLKKADRWLRHFGSKILWRF